MSTSLIRHTRPDAAEDRGSADAQAEAGVEDRVHAAITAALLAGKLRPGMPLRERSLAEAFDCTRGAVRKVLARLGAEGKLDLEPNRGAFVPRPSVEDIREVYSARRAVEVGIVATLCGRLSAEQLARLTQHVEAEEAAFHAHRREASARLAGGFHALLTEMVGSADLLAFVQRLIAKTELYKALYDPEEYIECAPTEHRELVEALKTPCVQATIDMITTHLNDIERRVVEQAIRAEEVPDVKAIFAAGLKRP
ncbi:GntR family transcriptional regulator [Cupriavidus lacunae]|uniref:GntR family transcriptional regulator n=1 Tax=Cupriavidus lacunae TaxID=2666307 RepID=A0A370P0V0_9BURK|nr:GntR family transcriptional regulator [Cupriavidus lacunae]RDK11388.1 GntR family transcriptional regulator [Cupriavidus lacunae]